MSFKSVIEVNVDEFVKTVKKHQEETEPSKAQTHRMSLAKAQTVLFCIFCVLFVMFMIIEMRQKPFMGPDK